MSDGNNPNGNTPPAGGGPGTGEGGQAAGGAAMTWDSVFDGLSDEAKGLYESQHNGLKSALNNERDARKKLEDQLKELGKKAKGNEAAEGLIADLTGQLNSATQRLNFMEDVGTSVNDPKLAYLAAVDLGAFDKSGRVNIETLKTAHPHLFEKKAPAAPPGNGGEGAGAGAPGGGSMTTNDRIRAAARRNRAN